MCFIFLSFLMNSLYIHASLEAGRVYGFVVIFQNTTTHSIPVTLRDLLPFTEYNITIYRRLLIDDIAVGYCSEPYEITGAKTKASGN